MLLLDFGCSGLEKYSHFCFNPSVGLVSRPLIRLNVSIRSLHKFINQAHKLEVISVRTDASSPNTQRISIKFGIGVYTKYFWMMLILVHFRPPRKMKSTLVN
jgi:hypothetical protein